MVTVKEIIEFTNKQDGWFPMHASTYEYLKPTPAQLETMDQVRHASAQFSREMERLLPEGPDKAFVLRTHRTMAMWANIAVTRNADGSPRT